MTLTATLLVSAATALVVVGAAHVLGQARSLRAFAPVASAEAAVAEHRWWGGRGAGRESRGWARLCSLDERIDDALAWVRTRLDVAPDQLVAWEEFAAASRAAAADARRACEQVRAAASPRSAADRLARAEVALDAGLAALQRVRPAFDRLYTSLDERQKRELDAMLERGPRT